MVVQKRLERAVEKEEQAAFSAAEDKIKAMRKKQLESRM